MRRRARTLYRSRIKTPRPLEEAVMEVTYFHFGALQVSRLRKAQFINHLWKDVGQVYDQQPDIQ